ncbi:MAG: hypothetical protein KKA42_08930, partial [candidate division Zixibacteria bacterium]|nr:hypothetical protein [candidate division Zixibacteria bacterium]
AFTLTVPGNIDALKVTLVWDDPGGTTSSSQNLINDLNLVLVDPFGAETEPWVLDPGNPNLAATRGVDHLNNVLTVETPNPIAGIWTARVDGYNVPDGPQAFSLVFSPDSIHTPGNSRAVAVYHASDITEDPGQIATAEFWVSNVGASTDSIAVTISDDVAWLQDVIVDSIVVLDSYDSAYFSVTALVPSAALAGDASTIACHAVSQGNTAAQATDEAVVTAAAVYNMALAAPIGDTVGSPDTYDFSFTVSNLANAVDVMAITVGDDLGWSTIPESHMVTLPIGGDTTMMFTLHVPAEMPHLATNTVRIQGTSNGGAADTATFVMVVDNLILPPELVSPSAETYTQIRNPYFEWTGAADSYTLYIATDSLITNVVRTYPGLTGTNFTVPGGDDLVDDTYWWAVRLFTGSDSSSLQRYPYLLGVDNVAPAALEPTAPLGGYLNNKLFTISFQLAETSPPAVAPDFNTLQVSTSADFTTGVNTYGSLSGFSREQVDTLSDGRWYWRVERVDLAGNSSGYSAVSSFVLDTQVPAIPALVEPVVGSTVGGDTVVLRWDVEADPPYETAPTYYYLHLSGASNFFGETIFSGYVYGDNRAFATAGWAEPKNFYWRVKAIDSAGFYTGYSDASSFVYANYACGDVDASGLPVDIGDLTYMIDYLFQSGPEPTPFASGAVDCDSSIDISDLTWLIMYLFQEGAEPCCGGE